MHVFLYFSFLAHVCHKVLSLFFIGMLLSVFSKIGGEALAKSSNVPFLGKNTNINISDYKGRGKDGSGAM